MSNKYKLSIITICYNEPNLERTCESIVNQTWQDFEWIVIDGGSNEETQKIWDKYKSRINKFVSEPDNGIYDAMNKGIKFAGGEYLLFLNAGDLFVNNYVLEKVIETNLREDIVYGGLLFVKNNKVTPKKCHNYIDKEYLITNSLPHPSSFIKKDLFEKYGLYNENYKIVSDWEKWIVFYLNNVSFKYIDFVISIFYENGISSCNVELASKERKEILYKYFSEAEINSALYPNQKIKYSFIEQIFSIKNDYGKKHKIITLFGIHIKIKVGEKK